MKKIALMFIVVISTTFIQVAFAQQQNQQYQQQQGQQQQDQQYQQQQNQQYQQQQGQQQQNQQYQQQQQKTPEQKANGQTNKWAKDLGLSSDQANRTYSIFLDTDQKISAIKYNYANSPDTKAMHAEEKTVHEQCENALQQVFTADQYTNYLAIKAQQKQQNQQQQGQQYQQR